MTVQSTQYAPAERAEGSSLQADQKLVMSHPFVAQLMDAVDALVFVLNLQRQTIYVNQRVCEMLRVNGNDLLLGLRPGEAVGCENAYRNPGGCGTSAYCMTCGGVNSILSGIQGQVGLGECRIVTVQGDAFELQVRATPLEIEERRFVVLAATDISHQKRREALERIFFHDVMNTVSGLRLLSDRLGTDSPLPDEVIDCMRQGLEILMSELSGQRDLTAAEEGWLEIQPVGLQSLDVLESVLGIAGSYQSLTDCVVRADEASESVEFISDPTLLGRVLCNLVKNAVEASRAGQTVRIGAYQKDEGVRFDVHNEDPIDPDIQRQLFQRSFSTKGDRRGLGTYSVRLLTHRYLGGHVSFESGPEIGTTFSLWCPQELPEPAGG